MNKTHICCNLTGMDSPAFVPASTTLPPAQLPGCVFPRGRNVTEADAAFAAGIALKLLDDLVWIQPAWAGCWCSRQALKCATVVVRLMGCNDDETALPDAVLLTAPGDDPGPAVKVFSAYKKIASRKRAKTCSSQSLPIKDGRTDLWHSFSSFESDELSRAISSTS